jgi:hypothetical protein
MTWDYRKRWTKREMLTVAVLSSVVLWAMLIPACIAVRNFAFKPSPGEGPRPENSNSAWGK